MLLLAVGAIAVVADHPVPNCHYPNPPGLSSPDEIAGRWYVEATAPIKNEANDIECATLDIGMQQSKRDYPLWWLSFEYNETTSTGYAEYDTARLLGGFENDCFGYLNITNNQGVNKSISYMLTVLDSDYANYLVLLSCVFEPGTWESKILGSVFSRTPNGLSQKLQDKTQQILNKYGASDSYGIINNANCPAS